MLSERRAEDELVLAGEVLALAEAIERPDELVRDGEVTHDAARRERRSVLASVALGCEQLVAQVPDVVGRDGSHGPLAPARLEVAVDRLPVVLERARLARLDHLDVAQEPGGGF